LIIQVSSRATMGEVPRRLRRFGMTTFGGARGHIQKKLQQARNGGVPPPWTCGSTSLRQLILVRQARSKWEGPVCPTYQCKHKGSPHKGAFHIRDSHIKSPCYP